MDENTSTGRDTSTATFIKRSRYRPPRPTGARVVGRWPPPTRPRRPHTGADLVGRALPVNDNPPGRLGRGEDGEARSDPVVEAVTFSLESIRERSALGATSRGIRR